MTNKKNKWTIERILFAATIIGWAVTAGMGIQERKQMREDIKFLHGQYEQQLKLNAMYEAWFELDSESR